MPRSGFFYAAPLILVAGTAIAQTAAPAFDSAEDMMASQIAPADATPSTTAYIEAMNRMHRDMMVPYSGDADVDFMRGMIPHHQGAIDMARVVLEHGDDPETRKLAEEVIAAQEAEIAFMQDWLAKNDPDHKAMPEDSAEAPDPHAGH